MEKILIIQTAFIGDVILMTPMIEKWHSKFPECQIDVLVRKGNESLLENNPKVSEILIWDKKNNKYKNLFRILKQVRLNRYDLVLNLQRFMASGLLTTFSKAKETRGFKKNPMAFTYSKKVSHSTTDGLHEVDRNISLISDLTDAKRVLPSLYPTEKDWQDIKEFQSEAYVNMAPTSVWFTKQLPFEKWQKLIEMLPEAIRINLLGAPSDKDFCDQLILKSKRKNIFNLCGSLSLLQSAALMKSAKMNYMNDSAPLHLASAMNAKTTVFFCSTVPSFGFGPLADNAHIIEVEEKLDCRPCGLHGKKECPLGHFKCGHNIKLKTNLEP